MYRFILGILILPISLYAQKNSTNAEIFVTLPHFSITETRVANSEPAGTFASAITELRFEPLIDVQTRNIAEAQGDVTIRGGIFENTGFRVGAATLFDPQTGHYFAEIPIAPQLLSAPTVITGIENAHAGFNSTVGSINYAWNPINDGGQVATGLGYNNFNLQRIYLGAVNEYNDEGNSLGIDISFSRSESDGTRLYGDNNFNRYAGRIQFQAERSQTDLFAGYQSKYFGWPNMYTPFNVNETENLQTNLYLLNHRKNFGGESFIELTGYHRRHKDDYEFNRFVPGQYNSFQHETKVWSAGIQGHHNFQKVALNYSAQFLTDEISSSNLVFGRFNSRNYYKFTVLPEWRHELNIGTDLIFRAGVSYDDTNRDLSRVSPMASLSFNKSDQKGNRHRYYFEYAESSQVAGYTAIASNPNGGLFRGKSDAARECSRNIEMGVDVTRPQWQAHIAIFYRRDKDLLDWTYSAESTSARTANNVDIDTFGTEGTFITHWKKLNLILGYTFLNKREDYGVADVDASFYALNFPRHRLTAALNYTFLEQLEFRLDNEFRSQEKNLLRRSSNEAALTSLSLVWSPPSLDGFEFSLTMDNIYNSNFEDIPATPAVRRQISGYFGYSW